MTTNHDNLEQDLQRLTDGPVETPDLWRRAVDDAGNAPPPARWRLLLSRPFTGRAALGALAASVLVVAIFAASVPSLRSDRRMAAGEVARGITQGRVDFEREKWKGDSFGPAPASPPAPKPADQEIAGRRVYGYNSLDSAIAHTGGAVRVPEQGDDRQVVRKSTVELECPDVAAAFSKAAHTVSEARGEYVQDSSLTGEGPTARATLTLRIAADRLGAALIDLRALGTVKAENTTGEDVTSQAVDLDARLRNEQRVETELLALLEKRSDAPLKDILELRQSLSSVRESIERLAGQRQHLSRLVSLATVLVIIRAPATEEKPPAPAGLWNYFSKNIEASWTSALAFLADTVAALLRILVGGIIWWTLAAVAIYLAVRHHRRALARGV